MLHRKLEACKKWLILLYADAGQRDAGRFDAGRFDAGQPCNWGLIIAFINKTWVGYMSTSECTA